MNHINIAHLFDVIETEEEFILVLEWCSQDLAQVLKEETTNDEKFAKKIFFQLLQALNYCHSKMITHRDIKLENILLSGNDTIKLADFGFSCKMPIGSFIKESLGSFYSTAPEILKGESYNGTEIDAWSCGVALYRMLLGKYPFYFKPTDLHAIKRNNTFFKGNFEIPFFLNDDPEDLIVRLLDVNP